MRTTGRWLNFCRALACGLVLGSGGAPAQVPDDPFPRPPQLRIAVDFWKSIYTQYSIHQVVFHHPDHLNVIYKVLDLSDAAAQFDDEDLYRAFRRQQVEQEKERLRTALLELASTLPAAERSAEARRLALLLRPLPGDLTAKAARAAEWVRAQRGLRETFAQALQDSGQFLPYIEQVFAEKGLPRLLSRLPFVESSFNLQAYSRSGAAGIWQFMPGSARMYMRYDEVADQRRDPWFSTHAAAGHLSDDYALLQDWPLAVTAYNYGRNGLARAREETGFLSLVELIEEWDGPRWGFAAKNFYVSFLAALESEQAATQIFGPIVRAAPIRFDEVTTPAFIAWSTLERISGLDEEQFRFYNPSFSRAVREDGLYVPQGQVIRLPAGRGVAMARAIANLPSSLQHSAQRSYFASYRVRPGDALSLIARRYGTSTAAIMRANNLRSASYIRVGQLLRIPTGSRGAAAPPRYHRVQHGETLWEIARRYGTSVSTLMADNNIGSANRLQVGQRLQIQSGSRTQVVDYRVRLGDTLSGIAHRYGTSVAQIKRDNGLRDADLVRVGQKLRVMADADDAQALAATRHRIRPGQTLEGIARQYGLSTRTLVRHNKISDPNQIRSGQWLAIPSR